MIEQLLTEHLDTWTQAVETKSAAGRGSSKKLKLHGIAKLRELILELAVRGQLVPQDESDEPASVLLERVAAERERLVKEEKLKTKAKESIAIGEHYISRPHGWEYLRLGNLAKFIDYRGRTPKKIDSGVPLITAKNIKFGFISSEPAEFISSEDYEEWMTRGFPKVNDVLFTTEAPLGNVALINLNYKFALAQRAICFQLHEPEIAQFLVYLIMSKTFRSQLSDNATGMTAKGIKSSKLKEIPVILPPIEEQKRIVAKVDELMALCDALEREQECSIAAHEVLVENLLAALTNAADKGEFKQAWARVAEHFDTLFTTERSVDQLKQTILQLAVMGKLVEQDPADEPAGVLLERIAAEKARLVKEKKIKKQKALPEISEEEKVFELPVGWEWCRLGTLINLVSGQHLKPQEYSEKSDTGMIPYLTGPADFGERYPVASRYTKEKRAIASLGDILVTCKGSGVGKINEADSEIAISRQLMSAQPILVKTSFIKLVMLSLSAHFRSNSVGIAIPGISREDVLEAVVRLPPMREQELITQRLEELSTFCESLKLKIISAQDTQYKMANTLTEQAVIEI